MTKEAFEVIIGAREETGQVEKVRVTTDDAQHLSHVPYKPLASPRLAHRPIVVDARISKNKNKKKK